MMSALALILVASACQVATATTYYVVDPNGSPCPGNATCHELSYYTSQPDRYFTNNAVFYFLEGTHELTRRGHLVIARVENLTLQGMGEMVSGFHETEMQTRVTVRCPAPANNIGNGGFVFMYSRNITIHNITLVNCGYFAIYTAQLQHYFLPLFNIRSFVANMLRYNLSLVIIEVYDLSLQFVSIQNSSGFGLVVVNGYGVSISHSSLSRNNYYTFVTPCTRTYCYGGNAALLYTNPYAVYQNPGSMCPTATNYKVSIFRTNFTFGVNLYGTTPFVGFGLAVTAGGLFIGMEQSLYGVNIVLDSVVAFGNTGLVGANLAIEVYESSRYYTVVINNTNSSFSNRIYPLTDMTNVSANASEGGGLYAASGIAAFLVPPPCLQPHPLVGVENPIAILNSDFSNNFAATGGGVSLNAFGMTGVLQRVEIDSCRISQNIGSLCMGLYINTPYVGFGTPINFLLKNVTVSGNKYDPLLSAHYTNSSTINANGFAIYLLTVFNCTILELSVTDNEGSGMLVSDSGLQFLGSSNVFKNNSGRNGGGIAMYGSSFFLILPTSNIQFLNNHADNFGGALYIDQTGVSVNYCFYQMVLTYEEYVQESHKSRGKVLVFSGNTADIAGSVLYGGNIENCLILPNSIIETIIGAVRQRLNVTYPGSNAFFFFNFVLTGIVNQTGLSVISSSPVQVCFCSRNTPNCSTTQMNISVYPGDSIEIPFVTLGQMSGTAPGVLRVEERVENKLVGVSLNSTAPYCSTLSYTITQVHNANSTMLLLGVNNQQAAVNPSATVSVDVSIFPCPLGFELSQLGSCDCARSLTSSIHNITCNISTLALTRLGDVWIGTDNTGSCLLVDDSCPFDYCNPSLVSFHITNPDPQCALNRSGVLCGGCAQGLSLLLGSNRCGECSNDYLSLLLPFALAGFALTALLLVLNLTVSAGTINGLIFYANIVKLGEAIFFVNGPIPVLSQFISWLNLDLGIETCFYHGMDSYVKTWLQFAFPFYIWIIMIVISVLTHYSTLVSKLVSRNTISVLATLILLSYMKLFRTINLALLGGFFTCGQADQFLWIVDANIGYFQTKHLLLGVFALIVLLFLALPFTLILLFSPLVERALARPKCMWKLYRFARPFFDAYGGPYEDRYRFWTGLLLLVRLVLLLVVSFSNSSSAILSAIVTTTAVVMTLAWWLKGVYWLHYLNVLESWFLINLVFLAALSADKKAEIGVFISVSVVLITFIGIVCYHLYIRVKELRCTRKILTRVLPQKELHTPINYDDIDYVNADRPDNFIDSNARTPESTTVLLMRRESLL